MELFPEEKKRIYEEEKARVKAQEKAKEETKAKKTKQGCLGCLGLIVVIFIIALVGGLFESGDKTEKPSTSTQQEEITPVFDLEALYGKNIDEIRAVLGEPTDGEYTNPTALQLALGVKEWDNAFEKDGCELLVTYNVYSREVIDFFIGTDDPSGVTKDTKKLEEILNVENSTNFTIEPVRAIKNPSVYTGIKVVPRK